MRTRLKQRDEAGAGPSHVSSSGDLSGNKNCPVLVCNGRNWGKRSFSGGRLPPLQGAKVGLLLHSRRGMLGIGGRCRGGP